MTELDTAAFARLFKQACRQCFGHDLERPLTETESRHFCNQVLELTGLSIGWKSVKNYSFFVLDPENGRPENPSTATLDTLARYVLKAPYTTEIQRKDNEAHFPWWFMWREQFQKSMSLNVEPPKRRVFKAIGVWAGGIIIICLAVIYMRYFATSQPVNFSDDFHSLSDDSLRARGWSVSSKDIEYWKQRNTNRDALTLFTLRGDNWPDSAAKPGIRNLLLRPIPSDCFTAELHMQDFIPAARWQQAGILLLDDTTLTGKSIRLSLAYNDYFGGYTRPREILVQAITSLGAGFGKPEEIAHHVVLYPDSARSSQLIMQNLHNTALRIEKHGKRFRFLYSGGVSENMAFKEIASQEFDILPRYIGLFAIKGFVKDGPIVPVKIKYFKLTGEACK